MAHRSLSTLVFAGLAPTTGATVISLLGDEGLPSDIRIIEKLHYRPWESSRSGLVIMGMDPMTDLSKVSELIQDRPTWWEVAVCLAESIRAYEPALLAQGALKVLPHPEDELTGCRDEIRNLLNVLVKHSTEMLGLELSDLVQLYGEKRVPKTIRVAGGGVIGSIFLRNGSVVHAETMDGDTGMPAFQRLFGIRTPEVRVHNGCLSTQASLNLPAMTALLEGARVTDEAERETTMLGSGEFNLSASALGSAPTPQPHPSPRQPDAWFGGSFTGGHVAPGRAAASKSAPASNGRRDGRKDDLGGLAEILDEVDFSRASSATVRKQTTPPPTARPISNSEDLDAELDI